MTNPLLLKITDEQVINVRKLFEMIGKFCFETHLLHQEMELRFDDQGMGLYLKEVEIPQEQKSDRAYLGLNPEE